MSLIGFSRLILLGFGIFLLITFHIDELHCLGRVLVPHFSEHRLESVLVLRKSFCVVVVEVEPNLSSETYSRGSLGRNESESIQLLRHLKVLSHQKKYEPLINLVALLWFWHLENETASVFVLRMLPTGLNSLFEKLDWVYATCLVVHDIAKIEDKIYVYILPPSLPK